MRRPVIVLLVLALGAGLLATLAAGKGFIHGFVIRVEAKDCYLKGPPVSEGYLHYHELVPVSADGEGCDHAELRESSVGEHKLHFPVVWRRSSPTRVAISGYVWDDNGEGGGTAVDGQRNGAEPGLAGAVIGLSSGLTQTTGPDGLFLLIGPADQVITVTEVNPPDYASTNAIPGDYASKVDLDTLVVGPLSGGSTSAGNGFGDVHVSPVITISGYVWDDNGAGEGGIEGDGQRNGDEPGLAGAVVSLSSGMTQTTGSDGLFLLYAPGEQVITVTEVNPTGYVSSTNAIPGDCASKVDNDTLVVSALPGGRTSAGNAFGDRLIVEDAVITGTVFHDSNENGVLDAGESGLEGITVTMETSTSTITATTGAAGHYQFAVAPGTDVRITSATPDGFYPTTPDSLFLRPPTAGVYPNNNFGYSQPLVSIVHGRVFDDLNGNG